MTNWVEVLNCTNETICCNDSLEFRYGSWFNFHKEFSPVAFYIKRILIPIWIAIGIPGAVISLTIWSSKKMRSSSSVYLCALAILDGLLLSFQQIPWFLYTNFNQATLMNNPFMCYVFPVYSQFLQNLSPLLTLAFTVERYISVCHPFQRDKFCTVKRALIVTTCLALGCLLIAHFQIYFYDFNYVEQECSENISIFIPNSLLGTFYRYWTKCTEYSFFLVVPVAILVFNIFVIHTARKISSRNVGGTTSSKRTSSTTTVTLLSVSFYQIAAVLPVTVCYLLAVNFIIPGLAESSCGLTDDDVRVEPNWASYLRFHTVKETIEALAVSHYAVKCILYLITGTMFRNQFLLTFCVWIPSVRAQKQTDGYSHLFKHKSPNERKLQRIKKGLNFQECPESLENGTSSYSHFPNKENQEEMSRLVESRE